MQKNQVNILIHAIAIKEEKNPAKFGFPPCAITRKATKVCTIQYNLKQGYKKQDKPLKSYARPVKPKLDNERS